MRKTALLFVMLLLGSLLLAQQTDKKAEKAQKKTAKKEKRLDKKDTRQQEARFLSIGMGASSNYTVDTRMAQNHYQGEGAYASIQFSHQKPKGYYEVNAGTFTYNFLSTASDAASVDNLRYDYHMAYYRNVSTLGEKWLWQVGGSTDFIYNNRLNLNLGNDGYAHDIIGSLSMVSALSRDFRFLKRDWHFRTHAHLPVVSYVNRLPEYSLSGWGSSVGAIKPIGWFNRLRTGFSIFKPFHKHTPNGFRFSYNWDFYAFDDSDIHKVRVGNHQLGLAMLIKL